MEETTEQSTRSGSNAVVGSHAIVIVHPPRRDWFSLPEAPVQGGPRILDPHRSNGLPGEDQGW